MAYDATHLVTVGTAKSVMDLVKTAAKGADRCDSLNNTKNLLTRGNIYPMSRYEWAYGTIGNDGADSGSTKTRIRSGYCPVSANTVYYYDGTGLVIVAFYNSGKTFINWYNSGNYYNSIPFGFTTPATAAYVRFVAKKADSTNWTDEDIATQGGAVYPQDNDLDGVIPLDPSGARYAYGNIVPRTVDGWVRGTCGDSDGAVTPGAAHRLYSVLLPVKPSTRYKILNGEYFLIHSYTSTGTHISATYSAWSKQVEEDTFTTPATAAYIRIYAKYGSAGTANWNAQMIAAIPMAICPFVNDVTIADPDLMPRLAKKFTNTRCGITFTPAHPWRCEYTLSGTAAYAGGDVAMQTYVDRIPLLSSMPAGSLYRVRIDSDSEHIFTEIYFEDDSNNVLWSQGFRADGTIYAPKGAKKIEARLYVDDATTLTDAHFGIRLERIEPEQAAVDITTCTYNLGVYNYGWTPSEQHPAQDTATVESQMKAFFGEHNLDILAVQEAPVLINGTDNAANTLYDPLYKNGVTSSNADYPNATALYTSFPMIRSWYGTLSNSRRYSAMLLNIHGLPVYVISVHLSVLVADRANDWTALYAKIADYDNVIIMGDLNAGNDNDDPQDEYDDIIDHGLVTANGGYWGLINTYTTSETFDPAHPNALDSVIVKGPIKIRTYSAPYLLSSLPSDHRPLMVGLTIAP